MVCLSVWLLRSSCDMCADSTAAQGTRCHGAQCAVLQLSAGLSQVGSMAALPAKVKDGLVCTSFVLVLSCTAMCCVSPSPGIAPPQRVCPHPPIWWHSLVCLGCLGPKSSMYHRSSVYHVALCACTLLQCLVYVYLRVSLIQVRGGCCDCLPCF